MESRGLIIEGLVECGPRPDALPQSGKKNLETAASASSFQGVFFIICFPCTVYVAPRFFFSFLEWEPGADYGINTNFFSFPLDYIQSVDQVIAEVG